MDSSNAEQATELDGATTPPPKNAYPSDAGQFAARWNTHTPEFRDGWVRSMIEASQTAINCFMGHHEELLEALAESRARFGDSEARRAELEAVIAKVRDWNTLTNGRPRYRECDDIIAGDKCWWPDVDGGGSWFPHDFCDGTCANCFRQEESVSSPSVVLEDRDREVAARTIDAIDRELQQMTVYAKPYANWKGEMSKKQRWYGRGYVSGLWSAFGEFRLITAAIRKGDNA